MEESLIDIIWCPETLNHVITFDHPESPERVLFIVRFLEERDISLESIYREASLEEILKVHKKVYVEDLIRDNNLWLSPDTLVKKETFKYASLSAGLALEAAERKNHVFALTRPPGHHAGYDFGGGFCYLNNIAIAVFNVFEDKNVLILDLDVHHGNGTEDIVERLSEGNIIYVSLHEEGIYPGTGLKHRKYSLNFPLPPGTRFLDYKKELELAISMAEERLKDIDVLALSMGFDTYIEDPLADLCLEIEDYYELGKIIGNFVKEHNCKFFMVLEGGYSKDLPVLFFNFYRGFIDGLEK